MAQRPVLRSLLWITPVFGVVWAIMILHWRASYRLPNSQDIAIYLVALPLALVGGYITLRYSFDAIKRRKQDAAESTEAEDEIVTAPTDPSLLYTLPILSSAVLFAAGDSEQALFDAAVSQQRPALHATLQDDHGLPIAAAEIADIDTETIDASSTAQGLRDEHKRALWIAETLAVKMLEEHLAPVVEDNSQDSLEPTLHIEWLVPARWSDDERDTALQWLTAQLALHQWAPPRVHLNALSIESHVEVLRRLDDINVRFHGEPPLGLTLMLASDSHLDEQRVVDWQRNQRLHTSRNPEGHIPGEGGCALLLGRIPQGQGAEVALLHRYVAGHRKQPVEAGGRLKTDILQGLIEQACTRGGTNNPDVEIGYAISDGDQRPSRLAESMTTIERALPEADSSRQSLSLGIANGDSGAAILLAAVAVAARLALEHDQAQLVFSIQAPTERAAVMISPPAAAAPIPANKTSLLS